MPKKQTAPRPWSPAEIRSMRRLAVQGISAREFGQRIGRSRGAVAFKAMTLKVRFRSIHQPRGVQQRIHARHVARR